MLKVTRKSSSHAWLFDVESNETKRVTLYRVSKLLNDGVEIDGAWIDNGELRIEPVHIKSTGLSAKMTMIYDITVDVGEDGVLRLFRVHDANSLSCTHFELGNFCSGVGDNCFQCLRGFKKRDKHIELVVDSRIKSWSLNAFKGLPGGSRTYTFIIKEGTPFSLILDMCRSLGYSFSGLFGITDVEYGMVQFWDAWSMYVFSTIDAVDLYPDVRRLSVFRWNMPKFADEYLVDKYKRSWLALLEKEAVKVPNSSCDFSLISEVCSLSDDDFKDRMYKAGNNNILHLFDSFGYTKLIKVQCYLYLKGMDEDIYNAFRDFLARFPLKW